MVAMPVANFFVTEDEIGFALLSATPIRKNPIQGGFIQDGTNPENDW